MWSTNIWHYWTRLSTVRLLLLVLTRPSAPLTLRSRSREDQQQQPSCLQPRPIMAVIRIPWLRQVIRITAFTHCLCKHRQRVKVDVMASHRYPKSYKYYNSQDVLLILWLSYIWSSIKFYQILYVRWFVSVSIPSQDWKCVCVRFSIINCVCVFIQDMIPYSFF